MKNSKYVVLDIDGTLLEAEVDEKEVLHFHPRPHLKEFLSFCFEKFESVSIWSASSMQYITEVIRYLKSAGFIPQGREFDQVYDYQRCAKVFDFESREHILIKPLSKFWRKKSLKMRKENTIIVDDTLRTYERNRGNAIPIDTFFKENDKDTCLLQILKRLERDVLHVENVRTKEKAPKKGAKTEEKKNVGFNIYPFA